MPDAQFEVLRPEDLIPWPDLNPRRRFPADAHADLVASIERQGIRQPLAVHRRDEGPHWIVAGERRHRAAAELGADVPVVLGEYTFAEALEVSLIENLQRADMTVVEEARGLKRLMEEAGYTQKKLGERIGLAQPTIANKVRLLELPEAVLDLIDDGRLAAGHARDLILPFARIPDAKRKKLWKAVARELKKAAKGVETIEPIEPGVVVRAVSGAAKKLSRSLEPHAWQEDKPLFDVALHKECSCQGPRYWYGGYFHSASPRGRGRCFDDSWWNEQQEAAKARIAEQDVKRAEQAREAAAPSADGEVGVLPEAEFRNRFEWNDYADVGSTHTGPGFGENLLDPALLDAGSLLLVRGAGGRRYDDEWDDDEDEDEEDRAGIRLVCTDVEAAKKAKRVTAKRVAAVHRELAEARLAGNLIAADSRKLEPWMVAVLLGDRPDWTQTQGLLKELGHQVSHSGGDRVAELEALGPDVVLQVAKILAFRHRDGQLAWNDPLKAQAERQVRAECCVALRALLPGVPTRQPPEDLFETFDAAVARLRDLTEDLHWDTDPADVQPERRQAILAATREVRGLRDAWWELGSQYGHGDGIGIGVRIERWEAAQETADAA